MARILNIEKHINYLFVIYVDHPFILTYNVEKINGRNLIFYMSFRPIKY